MLEHKKRAGLSTGPFPFQALRSATGSMTAQRVGVSRSDIKNQQRRGQRKRADREIRPFPVTLEPDQPPRSITARRFFGSRTFGPVGTIGSWKDLPSIAMLSVV